MDDTFSPAPTLEAALTRTFGPREEFFRVLTHALRQRCGGRVYLTLLSDGSLALLGLSGDTGLSRRCAARYRRAARPLR